MNYEKRYWKGLLNADDADFSLGPEEYVNLENARFGSTDFATGAINFIESIGSTVKKELAPISQDLILVESFNSHVLTFYAGYFLLLENVPSPGYYLVPGTAIYHLGSPPPTPPITPTTADYTTLVFYGTDATSLIGPIWAGYGTSPVLPPTITITATSNVCSITNLPLLGGTNIALGWAEDEPNNRFVYLIWNSGGNHGIYCYDASANYIYTVLLDAQLTGGLNFDKYHCIHSAKIENGCVYWTDNYNQPRRINIDAGIKMNHIDYTTNVSPYTNPLSQSVISWIRRQPGLPPAQLKVTQTSPAISTNFIDKDSFQFSYRYLYRDYETSTLSAESTLAPFNGEKETFNRIDVSISLAETIDQDVLQIDLVANFLIGGTYFIIKSWNKNVAADLAAIEAHNAGTTALTYSFYNDRVGIALDAAYSVKPYDSVPIYAQTIEIAKNRGFMGNYIIGYDTPTSTSLAVTSSVVTIGSTSPNAITGEWFFVADADGNHYYIRTTYPLSPSMPVGSYFYYSYVTAVPPFPTIVNQTDLTVVPYVYPFWPIYQVDQGVSVTINLSTTPTTNILGKAFKSGASYQVSISFLDNYGRKCGILTTDSLLTFIPDTGLGTNQYIQVLNWTLDNTNALTEIPDWAYYYTIDITKCLRTRYFLQNIGLLVYATKDSSGNYTFTTLSYASNLAGIAVYIAYLQSFGMGYVFSQGDIIKLYYGSTRYTLSIIDQAGDYIVCQLQDLGTFTSGSLAEYEIYTPYKQQSNEPNFEVAQIYKINNPATGTREYGTLSGSIGGDVWLLSRTVGFSTFVTETMSPNDKLYQYWFTDAGRPNFVDTIGQVAETSHIAYSNTFIPGSKNNGLSTFDALDTKDISPDYGPIQKLQLTSKVQRTGSIMLAICSGTETASIYLSENTLISNTGDITIAQSSDVIGTINQLKGGFGTTHPESVTEFRGNVYWWDDQNGKILQYSENGLFPVSNYKMTRYWKLFSDTFNSLTPSQIEDLGSRPFVFSGVDPHNGELLFSVPRVLATPPKGYLPDYPSMVYPFDIWDGQAKTLVYRLYTEPNRWQGAYRFTPQLFAKLRNRLFSFYNGDLYEHNQDDTFCNFYGTQYLSRIMFVCNQLYSKPKSYNNISVEGNMLPSLSYFRSEYPYEQASDLIDTDYETKEGIFYAALFNDKLSPQYLHDFPVALISGDKMRTAALKVLLEFTVSTTPVQLKFVNLGYSISRGHTVT